MTLNVSFYRFVTISDPQGLRDVLAANCRQLNLKGTILLATEGINAMLAGSEAGLEEFLRELQKDVRFEDLFIKRSFSDSIPFKRLLVKVKTEIVTFKQPGIDERTPRAPYVKATELDQWLKNQDDLIIIDTRNDFEVQMGKFKNALNPAIRSFSQFAQYVKEQLEPFKEKKIVTYCTGGIRCEKATAYLIKNGFKNVYQLEGGILEYLNQTSGDFFEGRCFVFDERTTINNADGF